MSLKQELKLIKIMSKNISTIELVQSMAKDNGLKLVDGEIPPSLQSLYA